VRAARLAAALNKIGTRERIGSASVAGLRDSCVSRIGEITHAFFVIARDNKTFALGAAMR